MFHSPRFDARDPNLPVSPTPPPSKLLAPPMTNSCARQCYPTQAYQSRSGSLLPGPRIDADPHCAELAKLGLGRYSQTVF